MHSLYKAPAVLLPPHTSHRSRSLDPGPSRGQYTKASLGCSGYIALLRTLRNEDQAKPLTKQPLSLLRIPTVNEDQMTCGEHPLHDMWGAPHDMWGRQPTLLEERSGSAA